MNSQFKIFIAFVSGAGIGSFVTWRYVKDVYERIAQEEIDSVKEVFRKREIDHSGENGESKTAHEEELAEYAARIDKEGYRQYYSKDSSNRNEERKETESVPYVISPDEFGEFDEYEKISLTYYNNHVLADENDEVIEDVEETVGVESLTHFGEYEDDSVFVRNDIRRTDYEILLDQRSYSDVIRKKPHRMKEE